MHVWLSENYLWIKSAHVIAIIAWMAGLLYLPRLFVYHTDVRADAQFYSTFLTMERRLLKGIMFPAMLASVILGALLALTPGIWGPGAIWLHVKFLLVFLLLIMHCFYALCYIEFKHNANKRSRNFFRVVNEVPAVLMVGIVILAIAKPF